MGGYQRFRLGDGPNAKYVWATSLQEAQERWRGVQADPAWDIYLIGHGYTLTGFQRRDEYAPNPPRHSLLIPKGITVMFYCRDCDMTDDSWEDYIVGRDQDQPPSEHFKPITVPWHSSYRPAEHILVFPSTRTSFRQEEMVQIFKFGYLPLAGRSPINSDSAHLSLLGPLRDGCALYVGKGLPSCTALPPAVRRNYCLGNYAYLSDILALIAAHHSPATVHWLACRGVFPTNSIEFFYQATSSFGHFTDASNIPPTTEDLIRQALQPQQPDPEIQRALSSSPA